MTYLARFLAVTRPLDSEGTEPWSKGIAGSGSPSATFADAAPLCFFAAPSRM
jgi:hypothetical protein